MKPIIVVTLLSLSVALLCLAQSLSQLAQEHNGAITCQIQPSLACLSQPHSITLCAVGAMIEGLLRPRLQDKFLFLLVQGCHVSLRIFFLEHG